MRWPWLVALVACGGGPSVEPVEIVDPQAHWPGDGFAEMVTPIRLPTSVDGRDRITDWLRIPDGQTIGVRRTDDGRVVLTYPRGTVADRVELDEAVTGPEDQHAWHVIDVRGTRIDADGSERFHCLRPDGATLVGFEWTRDDDRAERAASHRMFGGDATPRLDRLRRLNHCQACHDHDQHERTQLAQGGPRRATDDAGFYSMLDVLADAAPLEDHRPRDLNAGDPFVTISRPSDGGVPVARLDFARALASGRAHELAVCRSRRYLFDHMTDAARRAFAPAFADCQIR